MEVDSPAVSETAEKRTRPLGQCTAPCKPPCKFDIVAFGLCNGHRMRAKKGLPIDVPLRKRRESEDKKTHVIKVYLDDEQLAGLEALATAEGHKTVSSLLHFSVEKLAKQGLRLKTRLPTVP